MTNETRLVQQVGEWRGQDHQYVVTAIDNNVLHAPEQWYSGDGDNWIGEDGVAVESMLFCGSAIHLLGGPRDGNCVS